MTRDGDKDAVDLDLARSARTFIRDLLIALMAFAIISGSLSVDRSNAFPAPPPAELTLPVALTGPTTTANAATVQTIVFAPRSPFADDAIPSRQSILLLLSLVLATLTAFNLSVWRHLRRVYASPRRGSWGRS